jgi:hypothetical protein
MKFAIDHVFPGITVLDYETLYFDEAFNETLGTALAMGRRLLKLERTPQRIVRHVQFEPARDPQSPAGKAFGTSRASFVEQLEFDRQAQHGTWVTIPNLWPDRVRNRGTIGFTEAPTGGTRRCVFGEVRVSLFGFGGLVERAIVAEIEKSYTRTTELTLEYLARTR